MSVGRARSPPVASSVLAMFEFVGTADAGAHEASNMTPRMVGLGIDHDRPAATQVVERALPIPIRSRPELFVACTPDITQEIDEVRDVLISEGVIKDTGKNLKKKGAEEIDAERGRGHSSCGW